jgi:hypothetical protein
MLKRIHPSVKTNCLRLLLFTALSACITPFDIDVENAGNIAVVVGQISNLPDQSFVQLGLTANQAQLANPVSDARVWIIDETTSDSTRLSESATTVGLYKTSDYIGVPGHAYHVATLFPDKTAYLSETDIMPSIPGTVRSYYDFNRQQYTDLEGIVSEQPFLFAHVDAHLPDTDEKYYLKWSVEEVFLLSPTDFPDPWGNIPDPCFIVQYAEPQRVVLYNGNNIHARTIEHLLVAQRVVDWSFLEKHAFTVYQSSISLAAHDYWSKVDILANQSGSVFDQPPAALPGNVHAVEPGERALGYFYATAEVMDRFVVYRTDVPFPLTFPDCQFDNERSNYPDRCLDCTSVRNSSFRRPQWF